MRTVLRRLLWMPVTLFGIALVTFLLLDVVPSDRAVLEHQQGQRVHGEAQVAALRALRIRYGLSDADTGDPRPMLARFGSWCARAATFDLAPPGETNERFRARFAQALATSALLGVLEAQPRRHLPDGRVEDRQRAHQLRPVARQAPRQPDRRSDTATQADGEQDSDAGRDHEHDEGPRRGSRAGG